MRTSKKKDTSLTRKKKKSIEEMLFKHKCLSTSIHIILIISCLIFSSSLYSSFFRIRTYYDYRAREELKNELQYKNELYLTKNQRRQYANLLTAKTHENTLRKTILGSDEKSQSTLHRFSFINPIKPICQYRNTTEDLLIILVLSRGLNFDYRQAIRGTWGQNNFYQEYNIRVQTIFFVGTDDTVQFAVRTEQTIFNDIVEIGIPENYPFVAHKELASLLWTRFYCPNARIIFRADDDILLDIFLLLKYIHDEVNFNVKDSLYGWFRFKNTVHRADKWAVTKHEYSSHLYPPYTFGIGYLFSNNSCEKLIQAANHPDHEIIRIGDVYITGILRELAQVPYLDFIDLEYAYTFYKPIDCNIEFKHRSHLLICMSKLHIGVRDDPYEFYNIWNLILAKHNKQLFK